jgi:hypothetical protein
MTEPVRPLGPNHALLCGMVTGALAAQGPLAVQAGEVFEVEPEVDGPDYTGRTLIRRPSGTWAVQVVPVEVTEL